MAEQPIDVEPDYLPWSKYKHQAWRLLSGMAAEIPKPPKIENHDECIAYFAPLLEILVFGMDKDPLETVESFLQEYDAGLFVKWQVKWWGPALADIHGWFIRENETIKSFYKINSSYKSKMSIRKGAYAPLFDAGRDPFHLKDHSLDRRNDYKHIKLLSLPPRQLLAMHSMVINELRQRLVLRTHNSPVGDYAEWLVSKHFNGKLLTNSSKGVDVETDDGKLIQVKARTKDCNSNKPLPCGAIRDWNFTDLVLLVFDRLDYSIIVAYVVPMEVVKAQLVSYASHDKKFFIPNILDLKHNSNVIDITKALRQTQQTES